MKVRLGGEEGQGTVEAALVIPLLFVLMMMLLQPGIILYDTIVMQDAAAEGCRLMATSDAGAGAEGCKDFIRNRLSAIPQHGLFHVHEGGCSWDIQVTGDEQSQAAEVRIRNKVKPIPLIGGALQLLGVTDGEGHITLESSVSCLSQPYWLDDSASGSPAEWVRGWR